VISIPLLQHFTLDEGLEQCCDKWFNRNIYKFFGSVEKERPRARKSKNCSPFYGNNNIGKQTINKDGNMESLPQGKDITIVFCCQFKVYLQDSRISTMLSAFTVLLPPLLKDFFQKVLVGFDEYSMALQAKIGRVGS
jgi:hypothetical protein